MKQYITAIFSISLSVAAGFAQAAPGEVAGFYGGVSLREAAVEGPSVTFGPTISGWAGYTPPAAEDAGARALVFGGYRFANQVAVEAAFSSADRYLLRPTGVPALRRGVGLDLSGSAAGLGDMQSRTWNVDVYTAWTFRRSLALYGRLGYAQAEAYPLYGVTATGPERRGRDAMSYGVGLRYDVNSTLGLRLEYARSGRYTGDIGSGFLDGDQVGVGLQLRF